MLPVPPPSCRGDSSLLAQFLFNRRPCMLVGFSDSRFHSDYVFFSPFPALAATSSVDSSL